MTDIKTIATIVSNFNVCGNFADAVPHGNGHINNTYLITSENGSCKCKYILQKINTSIFNKPEEVMSNIVNVTSYLNENFKDELERTNQTVLNVIKTKANNNFYTDFDGSCWRMYDFVGNTVSLDKPETANDFYQSAVAFGDFQSKLKDYPIDTLYETIPNFHNTPIRYTHFEDALKNDACSRAKNVPREIEFVKSRKEFMNTLENKFAEGLLPKKVTHNDTKLNNILLSDKTRTPVCIVDLDTIMPGYSVNDFGDSIRFGASTAVEDEPDLNKVHFDINMFETYTKGFLTGCAGNLTETEVQLLPIGAIMMTLECGMRFLTDYLNGDTYFKTAYSDHNLVRCHTQFRLVEEMEQNLDLMHEIVEKYK